MGNRSLETYRQHQERSRSKSKSSPKDAGAASSATRASPRSSHREAGRRQSGSSSRAAAQDGGGDGAVQVAALDERNLKRAVNRYGTMPKGARIGAYLESLRQSGMTPEPVTDQGVDSDATLDSSSQGGDTLESNGRGPPHAHPHFHHSSLNKSKQPVSAAAAAQMLRSNSSHGGFGGGGGGGGRGSPIQRATPNNQLRRALTSGIDTPMRGATAAGTQHQLPSEDFLPPPPQGEGPGHFPAPPSHFLANRRPSPSPRAKRKDSANKENNLPERLKSGRNHRASDEEGSDADRSLQSPAAVQAASAAASASQQPPPAAFNSHLATPRSPTSPASECRTLGSPAVGSLSSPGSTMDDGRMAGARKNSSGSGPTDAIRPFSKAKLEQKLVDELKSKEAAGSGGGAHQKQQSGDSAAPPSESGPASLLVCELAESIKTKGQRPKSPLLEKQAKAGDGEDFKKHEVDFKANLRKVKRPDSDEAAHAKAESNPNPHEIDFKSNLKKTPKTGPASAPGKSKENAGDERDATRGDETNIVDFKAKLKKPKPMVPAEVANPGQPQQTQQGDDQLNFKARLRKVSGDRPGFTVMEGEVKGAGTKNGVSHGKESPEAEDDKRKSTGSISSLRRMWESSDQKKGKAAAASAPESNPTSPTSETNSESRSVKFEKRVWPPVPSTETEKPMVPVKPTMKPAAPTSKPPPPTSKPPPPTTKPPAAKPHPLCNIYAAPTTQARPKPPGAKPAIASKPPQSIAAGAVASATRSGSAGEASGDSGGGSSTATEKDSILSSSQTLESKLAAAKAKSSAQLSTSSLMQLSESVGSFHSSCASFADNVTPTGRFRFRSLLSRLEEQTQSLRSGAHCIDDIHSTVKDLVTVIQR